MDLTEAQRRGLNTALSEATCLGLDIDEAGATAAVTLEVLALPADGATTTGRTVVLHLSGVGRIAASLRSQEWDEAKPTVYPLALGDLHDAIASFGGTHLHGWEFIDLPDSSWKQWFRLLSLDTTLSDEPASHVLELSQEEGVDPRELDLRVWFNDLDIADTDGQPIELEDFIDCGVKWWAAHDSGDPRTRNADIAPPL